MLIFLPVKVIFLVEQRTALLQASITTCSLSTSCAAFSAEMTFELVLCVAFILTRFRDIGIDMFASDFFIGSRDSTCICYGLVAKRVITNPNVYELVKGQSDSTSKQSILSTTHTNGITLNDTGSDYVMFIVQAAKLNLTNSVSPLFLPLNFSSLSTSTTSCSPWKCDHLNSTSTNHREETL